MPKKTDDTPTKERIKFAVVEVDKDVARRLKAIAAMKGVTLAALRRRLYAEAVDEMYDETMTTEASVPRTA